MGKHVLISGGSGMIGSRLTIFLQQKGYQVTHLSRTKGTSIKGVDVIVWNVKKQKLSASEIEGFDYIIHLAGANIFDKAWTEKRKKEIMDSRIESANLLYKAIVQLNQKPKAIISASAVGYYGSVTNEQIFEEDDSPGKDFLARTCVQWEKSIDKFSAIGMRTVKLRQAMVLSKESDPINKLKTPINLGIGAPIGKGYQYMPWIHIDDLCKMYLHCIVNKNIQGSYNAVAPENVSNKEFIKIFAKVMHRPVWLPSIPGVLIRLALGEKSTMVLEGSRISSEKVKKSGFDYKYPKLEKALEEVS